jgi:ureidoglycolate dehydrogenase (NAD+)
MNDSGSTSVVHLPASEVLRWACRRLEECGVPPDDARSVAEALVQTNLWGIDSHGIARLAHYLRRLRAGSIEPRPTMTFRRTGPCTGQLDGGHALGILVCRRAMREAIALARENGVGIVGCSHSTHCGAIGLYGRQAAEAGLLGIALTHSDAYIVPTHGKLPFVGTNPICIAAPSASAEPVCVDMATSVMPLNGILDARRNRQTLPEGVAFDREGIPTTDPQAMTGISPMGAHKGYALAFLIDLLCGPLNGMPFGPHIPAMYGDPTARRNLGSLLMAVDPARFAGGETFAETAAEMAREARRQPGRRPDAEVLAPGDPEYRCQRRRESQGIPLDAALLKELGMDETGYGANEENERLKHGVRIDVGLKDNARHSSNIAKIPSTGAETR